MSATSVTVRVPGKVNLQLSVGPLGADGFHALGTVFQAVSLFDEVSAVARPAGSGVAIAVRGEDTGGIPLDGSNLAARAAIALASRLGVPPDVSLGISKGIPVAGGMAGGSADAAGALLACSRLWAQGVPRQVLMEVAATLGSDVPFLLLGGTAIGTGRGERLMPVLSVGRFNWVFATAYEGLATPDVYRRFDEQAQQAGVQPGKPHLDDRVIAALRSGDAAALGSVLSNDLQAAAISLRPSLQGLIDQGTAAGALGAVVSGSGPTVGFLVADDDQALALVMELSASGLCQALRGAHGPVAGARIVAG